MKKHTSRIAVFCSFFALLALFFAPPARAAEEALHKPQLYDYHGAPVDPLCFLSNIGTDDAPVYPTENCEWEDLMSDGDAAPLDEKRFVSTGYKQEYVDPETDEVFTSHGLVGYRAIGHVDGYEAVVQIENGGGSGTFTSVMLLETIRDDETETTTFRQHEVLSSGDRCMGGYSDARVEDGELYFTVNTTMADMFSLTGDRDREILKSEAARNLPFCAICCYAEAEFSTEEFRGVRFPETRMKPDESDNDAARCVENMVTLNVKHGHDYMGAEEFGTFIHELEHVCLGRMEGEE